MSSSASVTVIVSKSGRIAEFIEKDPDSPSNLNNASIYMIETEVLKALDALDVLDYQVERQ